MLLWPIAIGGFSRPWRQRCRLHPCAVAIPGRHWRGALLDDGLKGDSQRGCGEPCRLLGRGEGALVHQLDFLVKSPLSNLSEG